MYELRDSPGEWFEGPIPSDIDIATSDITQADLFERTYYWGDWVSWGTWHYDYSVPQAHTIVTRGPEALTFQSTVTAVFDFA